MEDEYKLQDAYFSIDVETSGPIPANYSMLSFAIVTAGYHDGFGYVLPERRESLYLELKPLPNASIENQALRINGLDLNELSRTGLNPKDAMIRATEFIKQNAAERRPVMVASPASFDWMFMHWYFVNFLGQSPFGYSSCFDLKTMIAVKLNIPLGRASVGQLPDWLHGGTPRTHNALNDARNQAQAFSNVMAWKPPVYDSSL